MSSKNLALLQVALPKFYSLKLSTMPNTKKIESIKQKASRHKYHYENRNFC